MKNYKDYLEAKSLMEDINKTYVHSGGNFVPKASDKMTYTASYIQKVKNYISKYENDSNYNMNVATAKALWQKYSEQHKINIETFEPGVLEVKVDKNGWWKVR